MTLREVQLSVLQILKDIDAHCRKNNIKYSLAFGTLLGAIRHSGFIPWDDDLDIYMSREDFNRFIETWNYEDYYLDNYITNPKCVNTFTKVKKTANRNAETPFFVDIFPLDKCPKSKIRRKIQQFYGMVFILMTRRNVRLNSGSKVERITKFFLKMIPSFVARKICFLMENKISKYAGLATNFDYFACDVVHDVFRFLPADSLEYLDMHAFEDSQFPIIRKYDSYLKREYGDYMKLPPVEKRVSPHFVNLQ